MADVVPSAGSWFQEEVCRPLDALPRAELAELITRSTPKKEADRDGTGLNHRGHRELHDLGYEGYGQEGQHEGRDSPPPQPAEAAGRSAGNAVPFSFDVEHWIEYGHVVAALRNGDRSLKAAPPELRADKHFVKAMVARDGCSLRFADAALRSDRQVVLAAVANAAEALISASKELRADVGFVLAALYVNCKIFRYAGTLQSDKMVALAAVTKEGALLHFAAEALQEDRDVVLAAVTQDGDALRFAARTLRGDLKIVMAAVKQTGHALRYAVDELRRHLPIVHAAVDNTIEAARFAGTEVWQDEKLVRAVLPNLDDTELQHKLAVRVPLHLWQEKPLVMFLVERTGGFLRYASNELIDDEEVVLTAVRQSGVALRHASARLRSSRRVVMAAVNQHTAAFHYALGGESYYQALQLRLRKGSKSASQRAR